MTLNKNNWGGQHSYESPSVKELELQSEGVLCLSSPYSTISDAEEEDWGTLY